MTFSTRMKEEIARSQLNEIENRNLLLGYIYVASQLDGEVLSISLENASVARKLFKTLKYSYKLNVKITVRSQKKFNLKRVYILEVENKDKLFLLEINNIDLSDSESLASFIKGVFLASGSISNPKRCGYHLEITLDLEKKAKYILEILNSLNFNFKIIKREKNYMLYLKQSEEISDFIKLLGAINSLFYFEDIRIYRDHKNMVNRLNNCEQANYEKLLKTSDKQLEIINFLKTNNYMSLLDEKTRQVANFRLKYPEISYQALADKISEQTSKKVTKSYINHHFRKITEVYKKTIKK